MDSTQKLAAALLNEDVGVVLAREQTGGVGRFGRPWHSPRDTSLSMTLILREYRDHPAPQYLGMAVALAAAAALRCQVAWPNDLVVGRKKLGGVLTEIVQGVPLVGVGVNLDVEAFPPEIADRATSLKLEFGGTHDPRRVAHDVVRRLDSIPEPSSFADLAPVWSAFDRTPGKPYKLPTGELAFALGVGADGRLLCTVDGETHSVMAADATFG